MERRLTAFVLPVLLLTVGLLYFTPSPQKRDGGERELEQQAAPGAAPAGPATELAQPEKPQQPLGDALQRRTFGMPGEPGSLHVVFDRRSASVRSLRLLDEPESAGVRREGDWSIDESYVLVEPVQEGIVSLSMAEVKAGRDGGPGKLGVDLEAALWDVQDLGNNGIAFTLRDAATGLTFKRTYRHEPGDRELRLSISVQADSDRQAAELAKGLPAGAKCQLWLYGLSLVNPSEGHILGNPAVALGVVREDSGRVVQEAPQRPDGHPNPPTLPEVARSDTHCVIDFAGTTNRFFGAFLRPSNDAAKNALWKVVMEKWPQRDPLPGPSLFSVPVANYRIDLKVPADGGSTDLEFLLYLGPKSSGAFGTRPEYERYEAVMEVDLTPVGCPCTIPGATPMAEALLWGLRQLHTLVGSWGVAIMLLTLIVRGSLVPLNFRMQKAMRAYGARMQVLKPKLDAIKERNAKDPKKMQQEMVAFQREHKLFPPLGGCLPLLVTIPVFLGLFTALRVAYELRAEPFIGWIDDLSQPDRLFELGLPLVPYFNLLPVLMVALWLVLQMSTPLPTDPQQRQMMKIMRFMPILFGVMLFNYASGLMVYMVTSSLLGIVEQRVTKKILGPPPAIGGAAMPAF